MKKWTFERLIWRTKNWKIIENETKTGEKKYSVDAVITREVNTSQKRKFLIDIQNNSSRDHFLSVHFFFTHFWLSLASPKIFPNDANEIEKFLCFDSESLTC